LYNSTAVNCFPGREYNFEYRYTDTASRRKLINFLEKVVPDGHYVIVRNFTLDPAVNPTFPIAWAKEWAKDTALYGSGKSLYHTLKKAGFSGIDSFYRTRPWGLVYKKNDPSFEPKWVVGGGNFDNPTLSVDATSSDTVGYITSPQFGPAKSWKEFRWSGTSAESDGTDLPLVNILGVKRDGTVDTLFSGITPADPVTDISSINPQEYPFVKLHMSNLDTVHYTPYQLKYWRLTYDPVPEGVVAPNLFFQMKDTLEVGEPMNFKLAFRNITSIPFDSLQVRLVATDRNNVAHVLPVQKHRPLAGSDTLHVQTPLDTRQLQGLNSLYVEVNPGNDQPEQYHFNNYIYRNFYVRPDSLQPLMDVTFDNQHIMNNDIVAPRPDIMIKLKDEAKWMLLDDTALVKVEVRYPNKTLRTFHFNSDTLRMIPAVAGDNVATVNLKPHFQMDGNYELIITGRDKSNNSAGNVSYKVNFQVYNKPMISNMLNYPNPFTTSTAFVFTITGQEVPQNIRIQIMTVTGKIVREITKQELGPLKIGRNITEFKWDGTDQYGQKLANGVYLYRVLTNLNGKSLEKFKAEDKSTDQYFDKGYGKMYLMR
ncbi:MAG TPA: hypothetical protein VHK69_04395, partial [Chitinophagaceae bacterium]|nr:hypothetical protein [Chitinophagaceae bacterium]